MKVIKKGSGQKGWAKELECTGAGNGNGGCGAVLLVEQSDIKYTGEINGSYCESGDPAYGFVCPECDHMTDVRDLPQIVTNNIDKKVTPEIKERLGW